LITRSTSALSRTKQEEQIVCEIGRAGAAGPFVAASTIGVSIRPHQAQILWIVLVSLLVVGRLVTFSLSLSTAPLTRNVRAVIPDNTAIASYDTPPEAEFTWHRLFFPWGDRKMGIR
jgi:hypothetical protein